MNTGAKPPLALKRLRLLAPRLGDMRRFYKETLGLPLITDEKDGIAVQAGHTVLEFAASADAREPLPSYHFAFNIPENRIDEAKKWTEARVPLIQRPDGREILFFDSWNAHALYFFDPCGNIVEFIARHTLPNASTKSFGPESILEASEIGLVVPDVRAACETIGRDLGAQPYRPPGDDFAAVGDERGLFIVVKTGRPWLMAENLHAQPFPTGIVVRAEFKKTCTLDDLPYDIRAEI